VSQAKTALDRINWDFPSTGTHGRSVHTAHWFPGNFISQIPAHLIQILSKPGQLVFDPFSGSGTTAIEAVRLGRNAIASDIVSACVFISNCKVTAFHSPIQRNVISEVISKLAWSHLCESEFVGANGEGSSEFLKKWYAPRTLRQLRYLWKIIEQFQGGDRSILELLFSDVLFFCAAPGNKTSTGKIRKHHWGWVADNVLPTIHIEHDAVTAFQSRLLDLFNNTMLHEAHADAMVVRQDARKLSLKSGCVDLIVTSPPYVGVIDYTRANRLLYLWKGWGFDADRESEIGARYKRGRARIQEEYLGDMRDCWAECCRVLKPGGYIAIILGESRKFPGTVDQTFRDIEDHLQKVWGPVRRTPSRRRVSDRYASEAEEFVAVFQKK
jgi:hypothetical protein